MTTDRTSILWRASRREHVDAAPLGRNLTADLLVVGGGFTGASAALEAARRGASVCLLEAETIGHGGSGRNVGLVNAGLWLPPDTIVAQMGEPAGRRLIATLAEAPKRVFGVIGTEAIDCEATHNGTLHLAHSAAGQRDIEARLMQGHRHGAPLKLLDRQETSRRTGTSAYRGALLDPRAGTIQPLSYCVGLARAAKARGAAVHSGSAVKTLVRRNGLWVATANGYEVQARALLIATNAYHLGIDLPFKPEFVPVSYCQFATVPMPEAARGSILPGREGCWDAATVMTSFRVDGDGRMIIGGIGNLEGPGAAIHASWARRKLRSLFPSIADLAFEHGWRGRISMTTDHIPKIVAFGPLGYACFGYSGRGIGPGTVFGTQAAAALLEGSAAPLPVEPVERHTERFRTIKATFYEVGATLTHLVSPLPSR